MTITFESNGDAFTAELRDTLNIYEVVEKVTCLLQAATFNYNSIMAAYKMEAERMEEVIKEGGEQ